jgi:hypothetical protein
MQTIMPNEIIPTSVSPSESAVESAAETGVEAAAETAAETGIEAAAETAAESVAEAATEPAVESAVEPPAESFAELLDQFEHTHSHTAEGGGKQLEGTVISLDAESVYLDIGYKSEGILPRSAFENNADGVAVGEIFPVSVKGRNAERYYELSRRSHRRLRWWGL